MTAWKMLSKTLYWRKTFFFTLMEFETWLFTILSYLFCCVGDKVIVDKSCGELKHTALYKISMLLLRFPHQFDRKKNVNRFEQFWVGICLKNSELLKLSLIVIYRIDYRRWDQLFWNPWLIAFLEPPSNLC